MVTCLCSARAESTCSCGVLPLTDTNGQGDAGFPGCERSRGTPGRLQSSPALSLLCPLLHPADQWPRQPVMGGYACQLICPWAAPSSPVPKGLPPHSAQPGESSDIVHRRPCGQMAAQPRCGVRKSGLTRCPLSGFCPLRPVWVHATRPSDPDFWGSSCRCAVVTFFWVILFASSPALQC